MEAAKSTLRFRPVKGTPGESLDRQVGDPSGIMIKPLGTQGADARHRPRLVEPDPSASGSAYGSGINVGKDSRRAAWSTPSPIASVLPVNVRSARRRQERAHQRRW